MITAYIKELFTKPTTPAVRPYVSSDYPTLVGWWKSYRDWENSVIPENILPPFGLMVEQDGKPVCATFLYETKGNSCCWMEWTIADPKSDKKIRSHCLTVLIESMIQHTKDEGYEFLFTSVKHPKLLTRLETKHGFMRGDDGMTNMIKKVK